MISCRILQPSEDSDQLGHEKSPIADGANFRTTVVHPCEEKVVLKSLIMAAMQGG